MLDLRAELARDPAGVALAARGALAQRSLLDFIRLMWPVIEPGRRFVEGWAVEAICEHLEAVTRGEIKKLLINVPPGCMKSLTTNVFWPAWEWGPRNRPNLRYISSAYAESLSVRDNRRCRQLIESDVYQHLWGERFAFAADQNAKLKIENTKRGFRIATSVGGVSTGERGDRLIVDDPHNVSQADSEAIRESALQWFTEVLSTRTNDDDSAFVVIMQRVHERDVSGLILSKELGYEHLMLPMEFEQSRKCSTSIGFSDPRTKEGELLWPERFSRKHLEEHLKPNLRAWGGTYAEAGQLRQHPVPRGGGMFKRDDFEMVDAPPKGGRRVRGWDFAASKDRGAYTAGVKMSTDGRGNYCIEDVVRDQLSPGGVEALFKSVAEQDGKTVPVDIPQDPGQAGKFQRQHFTGLLAGFVVHSSPETGSKEDRARPLAAQAEAGNLSLVRAPWNDAFISEAMLFPNGQYKDQIDAASRAFSRLATPARSTIKAGESMRVYD